MRRLYESDAVERDDEDAFVPGHRSDRSRSGIDWHKLSHALLPMWLRPHAISVSVETSQEAYEAGESVPFRVYLENRFPIPVTIRTRSPIRWSWAVDDVEHASHVPHADPPEEAALLEFTRRETKTIERTWPGSIRRTETEWEPIEPGEHTLAAWINVAEPAETGLYAETTIRVR